MEVACFNFHHSGRQNINRFMHMDLGSGFSFEFGIVSI